MHIRNPGFESITLIRVGIIFLFAIALVYVIKRRRTIPSEFNLPKNQKANKEAKNTHKGCKNSSSELMRTFRVPWRLRRHIQK